MDEKLRVCFACDGFIKKIRCEGCEHDEPRKKHARSELAKKHADLFDDVENPSNHKRHFEKEPLSLL